MRIFSIGSEGQVARSLREASAHNGDLVIGCSSRPTLDLLQPDTIERALTHFAPDIVVNPAAYTAVDRAETEPELAFSINRDGASHVAKAAKRLGIPVIHLSTDYVFDGNKNSPYDEGDPVAPQNVYGRSKLAGEVAVVAANERNIILRTSWVYAPFGSNFVRTILRLASERDQLRVVNDQVGCPTYAPDIAEAIVSIARTIGASGWQPEFAGITHLAGPDAVTWFSFAQEIARRAGASGGRTPAIEGISTTDYPTPAARPRNSRLRCERLRSVFGLQLPALSHSVNACIDRLLEDAGDARSGS